MHIPPPIAPDLLRRWTLASALAVACLLGAVSCGRTLATGPDPAAGTDPAGSIKLAPEFLNEVAVLPAANADVHQLADDYGATLTSGANYICVRLTPGAGETPDQLVARLANDPRVIVAERNAIIETAEGRQESYASDDGNGSFQTTVEQPAARVLGLALAQTQSDGHGVRVAVLDTGADPTHPLLRSRVVDGFDYVDYDRDPTDMRDGKDSDRDGQVDEAYGHGTHVAGIVALTAPAAELLVVRVLDADGRGDIASVTAGLRWAIRQRAQVVNLSLGMLHRSECIERMLESAEEAGTVVVCSAGNWGSEIPVEYPAASERAIAVAASDAQGRPARFTSYGRHVALSAPGVGIRSAFPGDGWRLWSGTSMSAPFVSGAAALLIGLHPDWSRAEVLRQLQASAQRLIGVRPVQHGGLGAGMLDVGAALTMRGDDARPERSRNRP